MKPNKLIPDVRPYVGRFARYLEANPAWGCLHIVLDDDNLEDHFVEHCVEYAKEEGDAEGEALAMILLRMSQTQRAKVGKLAYKNARTFPNGHPLMLASALEMDN